MPVVAVPGQGNVSFPDSMSDADIAKVIQQHSPNPSSLVDRSFGTHDSSHVNLPNVPGLQGEKDNFFTSPNGLIRSGARQAMGGIEQMAEPGLKSKMGGASQVIRGVGKVATPAMIPLALANPATAIRTLAMGAGADAAVNKGLGLAGAPQEAQDLGGDVAGLAAGGASNVEPVGSVINGAAKGAMSGAMKPSELFGLGRQLPVPIPKIAAAAAEGHLVGRYLGHPEAGAAIGAGSTLVKGAIEGGKGALDAYRQLQLKGMIGEPLWKQSSTNDIVPVEDTSSPPPMQGPLPQPILPSGKTPGPVQPSPQPPTQVRPLPTPTQNQPLPPKVGPNPTPSPRTPRTPEQIREIVDNPQNTKVPNEDMLSKLYDEYGNAKKEELVGHAKAKDENIASELGAAGVNRKVWEAADQAQRTALVKNIKFPEGHKYAGKSQHKGAPEEDWRVAYIGSKLPD